MRRVHTLIMSGFALFLITGNVNAADLDDLDVTIRVIESDHELKEMENELHLPDSASETAREHAEANDRDHDGHDADHDSRDGEVNEVDREDREEAHEDRQDTHEEGVEDSDHSSDGSSDDSPDTH